MKYLTLAMATAIAIGSAGMASAQDKQEPKFKVNPTGRILLDGALYASPQKQLFKDGFAIPDARLGVKMQYGNWKAKVDVGFAYNKVGLKDIYMEYDFNERNFIRAGSFIHQYGLQSSTSSSMKPTMEEPVSNAVFNDPRQIGVMYEHSGDKFLATASFHVEPAASKVILRPTQFTQEGYGFRTRLVARPLHEEGKTVQVGISGAFGTPQQSGDPDTHDSFQFASNFPTRVAQINALDATVDHAKNLWKCSPEILVNYGPVALESQYYFLQVNRRDGFKSFKGHGAYATLRGLILGGDYDYSMIDGGLATPKPKSLEVVGSYNYTTVTDRKAAIYGGRMNDLSLTFNYYINKYMIARLHYSYTHTWGKANTDPITVNGFMARLQVIF